MLEDKPVVESQSPKVTPDDLTAELHAPSDTLSVAYRKLRKQCLDMGWGKESHVNISNYTNGHIQADFPNPLIEQYAWVKNNCRLG